MVLLPSLERKSIRILRHDNKNIVRSTGMRKIDGVDAVQGNQMEIIELFSTENKDYWIRQIGKSGWSAGKFLHQLLSENRLKELCGETTRVFMLTDGDNLAAFCTLAELDDVRDTELGPWIGFVYTFPQYRGHRYMGSLLDAAYDAARKDGAKEIYISTGETGLYEKYGYTFYQMMKDMHGEDSRVYRREVNL